MSTKSATLENGDGAQNHIHENKSSILAQMLFTSDSAGLAKTCGIKDQYVPGIPESGYEIPILLTILQKSAEAGGKLICFSQGLGEIFLYY